MQRYITQCFATEALLNMQMRPVQSILTNLIKRNYQPCAFNIIKHERLKNFFPLALDKCSRLRISWNNAVNGNKNTLRILSVFFFQRSRKRRPIFKGEKEACNKGHLTVRSNDLIEFKSFISMHLVIKTNNNNIIKSV